MGCAPVKGYYQKRREIFQWILFVVFLVVPWVRIKGSQLLWFNIPDRHFHVFGLLLSAKDTPLIFLFMILGTFGLAVVTSLFGRVWCGWACPQTVFIERIYRFIDDHFSAYLKLPSYIFASAGVAHSFAAYFVGREQLLEMMSRPPASNIEYFIFISALTLILTFNFVWFRERFCTIVCPYGRIQNLLTDKESLTVHYDEKRGEPRRGAVSSGGKTGDCVSCRKCVFVCPVGIDIRSGVQMECIGCTRCIDACDEIMVKVNKPKGLIRYATSDGMRPKFFRLRSMLYLAALLGSGSILGATLLTRSAIDLTLMRGKGESYRIIHETDGDYVINHFRLRVKNQTNNTQKIVLSVTPSNVKLIAQKPEAFLDSYDDETLHFFIRFKKVIYAHSGRSAELTVIFGQNNKPFSESKLPLELIAPE